jgi:hypothetical protein
MSNIVRFIEDLRARLSKATEREKALVQALADSLSGSDERLLRDVRNITKEHEARRGTVMYELQNLASRMGAFPLVEQKPVAAIEYAQAGVKPLNGSHLPVGGADWREAVSTIVDEPDFFSSSLTPRNVPASTTIPAESRDVQIGSRIDN